MFEYMLECCVDSVASAMAAEKGGARRLELCSNLIIGGTTPTPALLQMVKEKTSLPVYPLIRPRFGDFLYSDEEFEVIRRDVVLLKENGADGMVVGCLNPDGSLCREQLAELMRLCGSLPVTLHRAFDMCNDPQRALQEAIEMGFSSILTSGQGKSCIEGLPLLKELTRQAAGRLTIMAGAGVSAAAIRILLDEAPITAFHMSGKRVKESAMFYRNPNVSMGAAGMSEYEIWETDPTEIRKAAQLLGLC